jgi:1-acyl-sn-glycerol-3-phosphate acyltransferase
MGRKGWVFWITRAMARMLFSPFFRLETGGVTNLPKTSAFIFLVKHQRWEDIPLLALATPRPLYYIAKHELFRNPLGSWFLTSLGGIPLNRERPLESRRSLQATIEFLKKGEGVVVFPEGTYYRGKMGRGHAGMVRLILSRLSLPFLPVGVKYSRKGWRTLVQIKFGEIYHADSETSARAFLDHMMGKIAQLSGL